MVYKQLTYSKCLYFEVPLNGQRKIKFHEIEQLFGKKIIAFNVCKDITPLSGRNIFESESINFSFTENGQVYFILELNQQYFDVAKTQGINIPFERKIQVSDCFITNPELETGTVVPCVFWYQDEVPATAATSKVYDTVFVPFLRGDSLRNTLPDYRTFLGKTVTGINVNCTNDNTMKSPLGISICNLDIVKQSFLTLQRGTDFIFDALPLYILYQYSNYEKLKFGCLNFDFESSFVQVARGVPVTPSSVWSLSLEFNN